MKNRVAAACLTCLSFCATLAAQQPLIVGTTVLGPTPFLAPPYPLTVAPGLVVTLLIGGLDTSVLRSSGPAKGPTLPFELSGLSATVAQGLLEIPVPLIELRLLRTCPYFSQQPGLAQRWSA